MCADNGLAIVHSCYRELRTSAKSRLKITHGYFLPVSIGLNTGYVMDLPPNEMF